MRHLSPLVLLLAVLLTVPPVVAQQSIPEGIPALGNRDVAFVAATPHLRFHSDFWLNLHDYLHGLVGGGPGDRRIEAEGTACFEALPAEERQAWEEIVAFYETDMADLHHRRNPLMSAIRYRLANLAPEEVIAPQLDDVLDRLRRLAPAYRECLWEVHDARNRERISNLLDVAVRYGPALVDTLSARYQSLWPEGVTVDVTPYASYAGANTSTRHDAPHMMVSSLDPDLSGFSGLELLFHESSHIVFNGSHGAVAAALNGAAASLGVEMPRSLWHAVSFHTSGRAVQEVAAEAGATYEPYWLRHNVFPQYHKAMNTHWQPYLDGEVTMDEAALALVRALTLN